MIDGAVEGIADVGRIDGITDRYDEGANEGIGDIVGTRDGFAKGLKEVVVVVGLVEGTVGRKVILKVGLSEIGGFGL